MITERMMGGSGKGLMFRGISAGANEAGHSRTSQSADRPRSRPSRRAPFGRDRAAPRSSRRLLAAWAALCAAGLALALAGAAPAQAQSNSDTVIYDANMVADEAPNDSSITGYDDDVHGSLSDDTFTFKGVEHTVRELLEVNEDIFLYIVPGLGSSPDDGQVSAYYEDLILKVTHDSSSKTLDFDHRDLSYFLSVTCSSNGTIPRGTGRKMKR